MAAKTIYCAQAFWRRPSGLFGGTVHQFMTKDRALAGGQALFTGAHGVAVFSVEGYPDVDLWEEPKIIATFGEVPVPEVPMAA